VSDNTNSHGGNQGYPRPVSPKEFLGHWLSAADHQQAWLAQKGRGRSHDMDGGFALSYYDQLNPTWAHYYSCALMQMGSARRSNDTFAAAWVFVLDDVGKVPSITGAKLDKDQVDLFLPEPSFVVETSHGNFQYGYVLETPETDREKWSCFLAGVKAHKIYGIGLDGAGDPTHYYRIPSGMNPKNDFQTRLYRYNKGVKHRLEDLAAIFEVDISPAAVRAFCTPLVLPEEIEISALRRMLKLIPNDDYFDRNEWVKMAHAISAVSGNSPEGRDVWVEWSDTWNGAIRTGEAERVWDTLDEDHKAGLGSLKKWIEERHGDYATRAVLIPDEAKFGVVEESVGASTGSHTSQGSDPLKALFEKISGLRGAPAHQTVQRDENWKDDPDALLGVGDRLKAATVQTAPPVIVEPHTCGVVSVVGGPPGVGKSLLVLQQGLAFVAGRPDLMRPGMTELNFPGDVVYVSNEDDLPVLLRRCQGWAQRHNVDLTSTPHKLIPLRSQLMRLERDRMRIECMRVLEALVAHVESGRRISMIVVDTLPASVTMPENSASEMGEVMRFLDRIAKAFWCAVVFIHHTRKRVSGSEPEERTVDTLRGSGALGGSVRGAVLVVPPIEREVGYHGWAGRRVVVECIVKSSDGHSGIEHFHEMVFEDIQVLHPEDATKVIKRSSPVLVPISTQRHSTNMAVLRDAFDKIKKRIALGGKIWVVSKVSGPQPDPERTVQGLVGVSNEGAAEIIQTLTDMGCIELEEIKDNKGRKHTEIKVASEFPHNPA
jgi:AAA domain/Primase C terminal 2 (PriCT-2)